MMERKCLLCWNVESQGVKKKKKSQTNYIFKKKTEKEQSFRFNSLIQTGQDWTVSSENNIKKKKTSILIMGKIKFS